MPGRDPEKRRRADSERRRRRDDERVALGLCVRCARVAPVEGGRTCEGCRARRRAADRLRAARRRDAGITRLRDPEARKAEYRRARQRAGDRLARGLCEKCGLNAHEPDRRLCKTCGKKRRAAERERYRRARQAGLKYGLSGAPDKPYYPERGFIPSDMPETALPCGFRAHRLGINFDGHYPPSTSINSSLTPQNLPRRISGGALTSRIFSLSAGVTRRYISVVLRSA